MTDAEVTSTMIFITLDDTLKRGETLPNFILLEDIYIYSGGEEDEIFAVNYLTFIHMPTPLTHIHIRTTYNILVPAIFWQTLNVVAFFGLKPKRRPTQNTELSITHNGQIKIDLELDLVFVKIL